MNISEQLLTAEEARAVYNVLIQHMGQHNSPELESALGKIIERINPEQ